MIGGEPTLMCTSDASHVTAYRRISSRLSTYPTSRKYLLHRQDRRESGVARCPKPRETAFRGRIAASGGAGGAHPELSSGPHGPRSPPPRGRPPRPGRIPPPPTHPGPPPGRESPPGRPPPPE